MSEATPLLELRGVRLKNRIAISPMSQYRAVDGFAQPWHLVHLGQFALGEIWVFLQDTHHPEISVFL